MKQRIPYFNFYPTDFIKGVRGLTPQEVGIYTMLLCRIYEESGPIDLHAGRLAAYCGCTEKVIAKVIDRLVYLGRLKLVCGRLSDDRADLEIVKRENALKSQSRAGEISAQKRKQNQSKAATGVQRTGNHTDTDTDKRELGKPNSIGFSEFWPIWPNKTAKAAAEKAWRNLSQPDRIAAIENAVPWFTAWRRRNAQASPIHPATYLNQRRWTDEQPEQSSLTLVPGSRHEQQSRSSSTVAAFVGGAAGTS